VKLWPGETIKLNVEGKGRRSQPVLTQDLPGGTHPVLLEYKAGMLQPLHHDGRYNCNRRGRRPNPRSSEWEAGMPTTAPRLFDKQVWRE